MPELGIGCWFWGAACFRVRLARSQTMLGTSPMISLPPQRKNPDIRGGPLGGAVSSKTMQLPCTKQVVFGIWYLLTEFKCKYQCCPQLQCNVFADCRPWAATVYHPHYRMNLGRRVSIWHMHETDFGGRAHFFRLCHRPANSTIYQPSRRPGKPYRGPASWAASHCVPLA